METKFDWSLDCCNFKLAFTIRLRQRGAPEEADQFWRSKVHSTEAQAAECLCGGPSILTRSGHATLSVSRADWSCHNKEMEAMQLHGYG